MATVPSNLIPTRITQLPDAPVASEDTLLIGVYNGNTYKIRAGDLLQVAGVPTSRQVIAGTGMVGGGPLASNVTLSIANGGVGTAQLAASGVTPGVYGDGSNVPQFTVDSTGRVMAATLVPLSISGYVPTSREVIAGNGLTGGGALSSNVTLAVSYGGTPLTGTGTGLAGTALTISRSDHRHPAVDLADQTQIDGILPIDQGGTGRSLTMQPGAVVWSGADGLYVSAAGTPGQVLVSTGTGAPTWGTTLILTPVAANSFFAGPTSGGMADPTFRSMVNADLPDSGAVAGSYGSITAIPVLTVNAKGVVTSITSTSFTGGLEYKGNWNAAANTPTLASGVGTNGNYYTVSVAGSTNLDGITDWQVGDWAIFNGTAWQKIDQSNTVSSVNGYTGAVVLGYSDVGAPSTSGVGATGTWGISVSGNAGTVTNGVYTTGAYADPAWLTSLATTKLSGTVTNAQLANSTVTFNGSSVALGGSATITAVNPFALTIGSGLGGVSYNGSSAVTITNTAPDQIVALTGSGTTVVTGTYPNFTITSSDQYVGTVTSVGTGTGLTGGPITTTGTVSFSVPAVGTWAATPSSANLAAAMTDETGSGALVFATGPVLSAPTIDGANPYIQFNNGVAVTVAAGRLWYNGTTGSWNAGMGGGNITQQIGEELFKYGKASAAISDTNLQLIYKTGVVGASGVVTFAPVVAGITDDNSIIGVATEPIALNGFGRVTTTGTVHGIDTTGSVYGEVWADNDVIWYNPVTGGLTKTKPIAPNVKCQIGTVINAGVSGSGSFDVEIIHGSVLGGTDSNVQMTSVVNANLLQYDGTAGYWKNVAPSAVTGVGSLANALTIGTGLSGTSFNGSAAVTIAIDSTVATLTGSQVLTNKTISGASNTLSNIANASLVNSAVTVNGTSISLGGSATITAVNPNALTLGSYLTGTSYNGSAAVTAAVDATSANTASKVVARDASGNFAAGIITASLSGNASTATALAGGAASQIPYQTGAGATGFIANGTAGQVLTSAGAGTPVWSGVQGGSF